MRRSRFTPGLAVLSASAAMAFGALVSVAMADHYHNYLNGQPCSGWDVTPHGLVHGSSAYDGYAWSRVQGGYCGYYKKCAIGNYDVSPTNSIRGTETEGSGTTCEVQTYGDNNEQRAWARLFARSGTFGGTVHIDTHYHERH